MTYTLVFQLALALAFLCSLHQNILLHVDGNDNSSYAYEMRRFASGLELGFDLSLAMFLGLAVNSNSYTLGVLFAAAAVTILAQFSLLSTGHMREAALRCFVPLATIGATAMNLETFGMQLPALSLGCSVAIAISSVMLAKRLRAQRIEAQQLRNP